MIKTITRGKHWDRSMGGHLIMACVATAVMTSSCEAQLFYDFVHGGTGDVLATLELTALPATHEEIVGLTFTPAGETFFGYVSPYAGVFDSTQEPWEDDGAGGLTAPSGGSKIFDVDPPASSLHPNGGTFRFSMGVAPDPGHDSFSVDPDSFSDPEILTVGDWRLVPEPSALLLFCLGALGAAALGRRRGTR